MMHLTLFNGVITFLAVFIANFIGATTGGSALLTIPFCIFFGFSPQIAVATTRFGVLGATAAGWHGFNKHGKVNHKIGVLSAVFASCGAIIGAHVMASISADTLQRIIGILMIFILIVTLVKKSGILPQKHLAPSLLKQFVGYLCFFGIGILGGIFGGQGVMSIYILVLLFGQSFLEAAGTRLIIAFVIAAFSLIVYQAHHLIDWPFALIFFTGMSLGTYLGAIYGIKKGDKWVQKLFVLVVILMSIKLIL